MEKGRSCGLRRSRPRVTKSVGLAPVWTSQTDTDRVTEMEILLWPGDGREAGLFVGRAQEPYRGFHLEQLESV